MEIGISSIKLLMTWAILKKGDVMAEERRKGMEEVAHELGHLAGSVEGLHGKIDNLQDHVENNTKRIKDLEQTHSKVKYIAIGAVMPFTAISSFVVSKWDRIQAFFHISK